MKKFNLVSRIKKSVNGYTLTIYSENQIVFEKEYNTFSSAKQIETKTLKRK